MDSKQLAAQLQEYVVSFRRELHEHPELSNQVVLDHRSHRPKSWREWA